MFIVVESLVAIFLFFPCNFAVYVLYYIIEIRQLLLFNTFDRRQDMAEIKFYHSFKVDGKTKKVAVKCERTDCYPGARIVNQSEIAEKLRRAMTPDEMASLSHNVLKKVYEYVEDIRRQGSTV